MNKQNVVVLGGFAGDEAKARIVHDLSPDFSWVIRFSGANNCGHTIVRRGIKSIHNLVPSVDWYAPNTKGYIGYGVMVDLKHLVKELIIAEEQYPGAASRIYVDQEAFLILDKHIEEDKTTNKHLGTTNRGVGPSVVDKVARRGKRVCDAVQENDPSILELKKLGVHFVHLLEMREEFEKGSLLFEGGQGGMLSLQSGTYPYVTSSECMVAGVYSSGFHFVRLDKVFGVINSAYFTKVGAGPFVTKMPDEEAAKYRELGGEYGATTGRPRDIGYVDLTAARYVIKTGGVTHLIVTKLDLLDGQDKVKVCTSYDKEPVCPADFFTAKPNYEEFSCWDNAKTDKEQVDAYLTFIERHTNLPVEYYSAGVNPEDLFKR